MKPPRLFDDVMEVISRIKQSKGLTFQHIVHEVQAELRKKDINIKNVFEMVKQALLYGTKSGLILKKDGHYQMALSREDYGVYKKFRTGQGNFTSDEGSMKSSRSVTSESDYNSDTASERSRSSKGGKAGQKDRGKNTKTSKGKKPQSPKPVSKKSSSDESNHKMQDDLVMLDDSPKSSKNSLDNKDSKHSKDSHNSKDSRHSSMSQLSQQSQKNQKKPEPDKESSNIVGHQHKGGLHDQYDGFIFKSNSYGNRHVDGDESDQQNEPQ